MPVPPPPDWGGLWSAVQPHVTWPVTDEDRVRNGLGQNWTNAGASFQNAGAPRSSDQVTTGWSDDAGQEYQAKIRALRGSAAKVGDEMRNLGGLATKFADDVAHTKTSISDLIKKHAWAYSHMKNFFGWRDVEGQKRFATQLATSINEFIDAMAARMVMAPESLDVVVASNLFGDILTDLGAAIQGGLGFAASANINPDRSAPSMFEPVHGSAPDIAHLGIANPIAAIWSAAMMLDHLGEAEPAARVMAALEATTARGVGVTPGKDRTDTITEAVLAAL